MTTKGGYREGKIYPKKGIIRPTIYRGGETSIIIGDDGSKFEEGTEVVFFTVPHSGSTTRAIHVDVQRKTRASLRRPVLRPR